MIEHHLLGRWLLDGTGFHETAELLDPPRRTLRLGHALKYFDGELDTLLADRDLGSGNQAASEPLAPAAERALEHDRTVSPRAI